MVYIIYFNKSYKQYSPFGIFAVLRSSLNSGRPSAVIRSIFISYFRIKNVFSVFSRETHRIKKDARPHTSTSLCFDHWFCWLIIIGYDYLCLCLSIVLIPVRNAPAASFRLWQTTILCLPCILHPVPWRTDPFRQAFRNPRSQSSAYRYAYR